MAIGAVCDTAWVDGRADTRALMTVEHATCGGVSSGRHGRDLRTPTTSIKLLALGRDCCLLCGEVFMNSPTAFSNWGGSTPTFPESRFRFGGARFFYMRLRCKDAIENTREVRASQDVRRVCAFDRETLSVQTYLSWREVPVAWGPKHGAANT